MKTTMNRFFFTLDNNQRPKLKYLTKIKVPCCAINSNQPERSKRENLNNGYFPPPWNISEFPEKTDGWCAFQDEMRKNPDYYLGCGALNIVETQ